MLTIASLTSVQYIVVAVQGESRSQSKGSRCIGDESWDMSVNIILKVQPTGQILQIVRIFFVVFLFIDISPTKRWGPNLKHKIQIYIQHIEDSNKRFLNRKALGLPF